jgi:surface protein
MSFMFYGASSITSLDLSNFDTSKVIDMSDMFHYSNAFNQDISSWNVSNVTSMAGMFSGAESFNQDIGSWNLSKLERTSYMFKNTKVFNQDISSWDVSNVIRMFGMFDNAEAFNQDIGSWNVEKVSNMEEMFKGATLSTVNYNSLLSGWSGLSLKHNVTFDGGNSRYSSTASDDRQSMIDNFEWNITDGGKEGTINKSTHKPIVKQISKKDERERLRDALEMLREERESRLGNSN